MKLELDRSSVAASDDVDSHETAFEVADGLSLVDALASIVASRYLASIGGGNATWVVSSNETMLAVVAQQWRAPRALPHAPLNVAALKQGDAAVPIFFGYFDQKDPQRIYEALIPWITLTEARAALAKLPRL